MAIRVSVLRDKNVDLKRLKRSPNADLMDVYELSLENRPKHGNFVTPLGVYDVTEYDKSVFTGEEDAERLTDILRIMGGGRQSIADALTIDAAFRNGHLYVVTNDKDEFIRDAKRERLEALLPEITIVTPDELELAIAHENSLEEAK